MSAPVPSTGANGPLACGARHLLLLVLAVFFLPVTGINTPHVLVQLAQSGGSCLWWWLYVVVYIYMTMLVVHNMYEQAIL